MEPARRVSREQALGLIPPQSIQENESHYVFNHLVFRFGEQVGSGKTSVYYMELVF